jgi:hypothetical protein
MSDGQGPVAIEINGCLAFCRQKSASLIYTGCPKKNYTLFDFM